MIEIGVQTKNAIREDHVAEDYLILKRAGFGAVDLSVNGYLYNRDIYENRINDFFDKSKEELEEFFYPQKEAAAAAGIRMHQMHMPYPIYNPQASDEINEYLQNTVAIKSLDICSFMECTFIVIHGFKLYRLLGSEAAEWEATEAFIRRIAPIAAERGIIICIENLYDSLGGRLIEGPCCNAARACERIDAINKELGQEVLGFCYDVGHGNLVGLDPEDFISKLGNRLKVLHIHDNDGRGDLHQIPYTFTKTRDNLPSTDWKGFLNGLRAVGFDGVLSFETAPVLSSFPESMREDVLRFICRIGEDMRDSIEGH